MLALAALTLVMQTEAKLTGPHLVGDLRIIEGFRSSNLKNSRSIRLYLPPGYDRSKARYPVLYLQDGQNLFDPALSGISHNEWRVDETTEALINAKLIPPMIVVGIDNTPQRIDEYVPTRSTVGSAKIAAGGKADLYLKFLIEELKPFIDSHYRTKPDREHTAIGGSSFGGNISLYAGLTRSEVFSKLLIVSPGLWWDNRALLKEVDTLPKALPLKIWVDIGTSEAGDNAKGNEEAFNDAAQLVQKLEHKGWKMGKDLWFFIDYDAQHTESAWAHRFGMMLLTLFR
jgi:predicted alpha/beta superfamily hydrolase